MSELHLLVQCGAILLNVMSTISVLRFITGSRDCGHDLLPCLQRHWGLKEPKMSRQGAQSGKQAVGGAWQIQLVGVQRWSSTRQDRGQIWILFETLLKCKDEDHHVHFASAYSLLGKTNAPPSLANKYAKQTFHEMWDYHPPYENSIMTHTNQSKCMFLMMFFTPHLVCASCNPKSPLCFWLWTFCRISASSISDICMGFRNWRGA